LDTGFGISFFEQAFCQNVFSMLTSPLR
jgi:hypothetical protein